MTPSRSSSAPPTGLVSRERAAPDERPVTFIAGPAEARLAALRHEADAIVGQLDMTITSVTGLLAARAGEVSGALGALRAALADAAVVTADSAAEDSISSVLELLARPAPMRQRDRLGAHARRIAEAAADLHGDVVAAVAQARVRLDRATLQALRRFEKAHDELQMQLRVAAAIERLTRGLRGRDLEERRRRLGADVAALSRQLEERRSRLAAQRERSALLWRELDAELHAGVEEVGAQLARLLA